jgi:molybdopterin/thiamine biosynthesis adenylyltransferase
MQKSSLRNCVKKSSLKNCFKEVKVMLQEALYERQNLINDLEIPKVASVVGLGGTGFWTTVFLAMSGIEELILVDADIVEVSNLNRLPLKEDLVGVRKTEAVKGFIQEIRKLLRIEIHNIRIEKPEDCQILRGVVFCCTDNLKSQQIICAYCKKNKLSYQRIGYDGTILNVSKTFPLSFKEETEQGGYTTTPSWVIPAVFAAAAGVSSRTYKELCLMDDIGKLHIQHSSYVPEHILDEAREGEKEYILDNIEDYIPDGYGYCEDCNKCSDCHKVDPDEDGYGYCESCEERYSEDEIEDIKEKARQDLMESIIEQLESAEIKDGDLEDALKKWLKKKGEKIPCLA